MPTENPFKGPSSYEDGDKFYGRENEIKELSDLIKNETLTLLFSRSGTGKSSLIKAGIFPVLKEECVFFPVYIHLNDVVLKETSAKNLCDYVIKRSNEEITKYFLSKENFRIILSEYPKFDSLFEFAHNLQIIGSENSPATDEPPIEYVVKPVFFFDQFEEIFTQPFDKDELQYLLKEIKCLVENEVPDYLKNTIISSRDTQSQKLRNALKSKQKNFRVVFSFREEYLPQFESLRKEIPSIRFTNSRYRLEPFNISVAKEIIVKTAPSISKETALNVAESIALNAEGFDEDRDDPFLLSLICQIIYPDLLQQRNTSPEDAKVKIKSLVENAIESYVTKVYKTIDEQTKKFIEKNLITSDGKKNSVNYNEVENNSKLKSDIKNLVEDPDYRLLSIGQFLDSKHISILHDRLLPPLIKRKGERKSKEDYEAFIITQKEWNAKNRRKQMFLLAGFMICLIIFGSFYYVIYQGKISARNLKISADNSKDTASFYFKQADTANAKAELANIKAAKLQELAASEYDSSKMALAIAKENQRKYLNQKELTDSIKKVTASLIAIRDLLQSSVDSNNIQKDITNHYINYYLKDQSSLMPLIFNRLFQAKRESKDKYNSLIQSIDSVLKFKTNYTTSANSRNILEIKNFWEKNQKNEVVDSIITGFLNQSIYYQQKIELNEDNKPVQTSLSVPDVKDNKSKQPFTLSYNNNYSGIFYNNEISVTKNSAVSYTPGREDFEKKYKVNGNYPNVTFSDDSAYAVTYSNNKAFLYNVKDTFDNQQLKNDSIIISILFAKNSKKILILSKEGLSIYDPALRYKKVQVASRLGLIAANFTNDGNKVIGIRNPGYVYIFDISKLDSLHSNLVNPSFIGSIPFSNQTVLNQKYSVSLSPDETKMLLRTMRELTIVNSHNPDSSIISSSKNYTLLPCKKFYSNDIISEAAFLNSNSIVAIGDSANVYLLKIHPDFKTPEDAFNNIKIPPLSIIDSLKSNPSDKLLYEEILNSNNKRFIRDAAQFYYENPPADIVTLNYSRILYKNLIDNSSNNGDKYVLPLISVLQSLSNVDTSYQNKAMYYTDIVKLDENYTNISRSTNRISSDYGDLAFYSFFTKDFKNGLNYASTGIQIDSTNDFIYTNLALGYLFTKQFEQAEDVYRRFVKDTIRSMNLSFRDGFEADLKDLEAHNVFADLPPNDHDIIYEEVKRIKKNILEKLY